MITPLVEALKAAIAAGTRPFPIRVEGVGVFPNSQRPRTIWVGIISEELKELAARIDRAAVQCGFHSEPRTFVPHITIARLRKLRHWKALREALGERVSLAFGSSMVNQISIYHSFKEDRTRIYEEIASFPLAQHRLATFTCARSGSEIDREAAAIKQESIISSAHLQAPSN